MASRLAVSLRAALGALLLLCCLATAAAAEPVSSRYGLYLTRLDDFDIRGTSFSATFWLFTTAEPPQQETLQTLEFPNGSHIEATNHLVEKVDGKYWLQERIQGSFRHSWDLSHYPFTRQTLRVEIESVDDADKVRLLPDLPNTGFDRDIEISGWRIVSVHLVPVVKTYDSNFGDPRLAPGSVSKYSKLELEIVVEQTDPSAFLTMVITPVIAFFITLVTYLLFSRELGLLTARLSLLVGTIFAVVISMRSVANELGSVTSINLLDVVHISALVYTTIGIAAAVHTWWALKHDADVRHTHRIARLILWASTAALVLVLALSFTDAYFQPDGETHGQAAHCCRGTTETLG